MLTPTGKKLLLSWRFWEQRCEEQVEYINSLKDRDLIPLRRWELMHSALLILQRCNELFRKLKWAEEETNAWLSEHLSNGFHTTNLSQKFINRMNKIKRP